MCGKKEKSYDVIIDMNFDRVYESAHNNAQAKTATTTRNARLILVLEPKPYT